MSNTADREIVITRLLDAPRELVWEAWTDPKHLIQWWGPKEFRNTFQEITLAPGGVWRFIMHGPDGRDYQNKVIFDEIVKPSRMVYRHTGDEGEPVFFQSIITFEDVNGKTRLTLRAIFASAEECKANIEENGAVEGGNQTIDRLAEHLKTMKPTGGTAMSEDFVITRTFNAPRDLVWKAWTEKDRLMQWFSPKGFKLTTANLDFRPGGVFHYCMQSADGKEMWGKQVYREIVPPSRIVLIHSFSDAQGGITVHPMAPTWPREMLSTATFEEKDGKTTITLRWATYNPTPEEQKTFDASQEGMTMGWTGTFEQLTAYLAKEQKKA